MVEVELDGVAPGGVDLPDALRVGGRGVGKTGRRQLQVRLAQDAHAVTSVLTIFLLLP